MSDTPIYDETARQLSPDDITDPNALPPETETPPREPSTRDILSDPPRYAKALMGAALAGTGAAAIASADGFTNGELWGILATTVAAFVGVYGIRNRT